MPPVVIAQSQTHKLVHSAQDTWHMSELGHTYLTDMLMWLVKSGLEQLCIRTLTSGASSGPTGTAAAFPVRPLRPSLLEPEGEAEVLGVAERKYKLCALASGMEPYVTRQDKGWEYNSDGRFVPSGSPIRIQDDPQIINNYSQKRPFHAKYKPDIPQIRHTSFESW